MRAHLRTRRQPGHLALRRWRAVMLVELDGPRQREVVATILGS